MIFAAESVDRQIDHLEVEARGERFLAPRAFRRADGRALRHVGDHVADVDHADRIVERLVVDDEARMAGALEHLDQVAQRNVLLHRDDVGARHHHVIDPAPAQRQDIGEHGALLRREAAFTVRAAFQHGLQIGARGGLPAEHRAQHASEPGFARLAFRLLRRLRHEGR